MLVTVVAVANADNTGLDLDRLEKVEDLPDEIAQKMLDGGTGRKPSESELATYREALNAEPQAPYDNGGNLPAGIAPILSETSSPSITSLPASE
jgi:hypothetical protein